MNKNPKNTAQSYWRSLDQLHDTKAYRKYLLDRHSGDQPDKPNNFSRRSFMSLMGASLALAGLAGCRRPVEKIVPYVSQPEEVTLGVPRKYATTMPLSTSAYGMLVECVEGRPIKIEGNPDHPSTLGSSSALMQATILGLYDPDRSQSVRYQRRQKEQAEFTEFWEKHSQQLTKNKGASLAVLSEPYASPTLARLRSEFHKMYPEARWYVYEPVGDEKITRAAAHLSGQALRPVNRYDNADIILSLDSDFLHHESESITAARRFALGRKMESPGTSMNRLYVVEGAFSVTGGMADHRLPLRSSQVGDFAINLCRQLVESGLVLNGIPEIGYGSFDRRWLKTLADDLMQAEGRCLIVAGRRQPQWVHELTLHLNQALGSVGTTIELYPVADTAESNLENLTELTHQLNSGDIGTLFILGGNPVYDAPADLGFDVAIQKVENCIHLSAYYDETSQLATWHLPRAHFLESWGDARASDGTRSIIQPMIEPLFGGKSDAEVYSLLAGGGDLSSYEIVRETWRGILQSDDFEKQWRRVLHDGLLSGGEATAKFSPIRLLTETITSKPSGQSNDKNSGLEVGFYTSRLHDGRFANNGWLQESPDPVTRLAWDNAAEIGPGTASALNLKTGDVARLDYEGASIEAPVFVCPGYVDDLVVLPLGFGRNDLGRVANGVGFNAYALRRSNSMDYGGGAVLTPVGRQVELANTQDHSSMEGRAIVREAKLEQFRENPNFASEMVEHPPLKSIYPDYDYSQGYQWGMVIDLNACNGCNACVIACQSENNIPIVGREQVTKGREMHWIRNDRYFVGSDSEPRMVHQPVACQQCENAPCEQVCPVAATVHDREGLNTMNYNRCIGTRYCSNNCPYKVRRFNFFNYTNELPQVVQMAQNPDVTVRSRGVMEKCTFCIQRIKRVKSAARQDGRSVADGEIMTACEQACPANAISFGNINDPNSEVSKLKENPRNYSLLGELNVRPRNSYLARLRNPNTALEGHADEEA